MTGAAVLLALLGGFWLVRIGLRPLRDMERTAEAIAAGNLTERVPGENETTEVGRLARDPQRHAGRIESAFGARVASERPAPRLGGRACGGSWPTRPTSCARPIAAVSAYAELFGRGASEQKAETSNA